MSITANICGIVDRTSQLPLPLCCENKDQTLYHLCRHASPLNRCAKFASQLRCASWWSWPVTCPCPSAARTWTIEGAGMPGSGWQCQLQTWAVQCPRSMWKQPQRLPGLVRAECLPQLPGQPALQSCPHHMPSGLLFSFHRGLQSQSHASHMGLEVFLSSALQIMRLR